MDSAKSRPYKPGVALAGTLMPDAALSALSSADMRRMMVDCQIRPFDVTDQRVLAAMLVREKPGGHAERSIPTGIVDTAVWDAVGKIKGVPTWKLSVRPAICRSMRMAICRRWSRFTEPVRRN